MGFLQFSAGWTSGSSVNFTAKLTLLDFTIKGGWVMIPIILLSFVAAYIFIERYFVIKRATREDQTS